MLTFGRAHEALRTEMQKQLRDIQSHIPFRYARFHGIFHDDMMVFNQAIRVRSNITGFM